MDSFRRAATSGAVFSLLSIVAVRALGFLTSLFLARTLGPHGLGSYSILTGFNSVGILLAGLGITIIAPKLVAESALPNGGEQPASSEIIRSLIAVTGLAGIAAGLLVAFASPVLSQVMFDSVEAWPTIALVGAAVVAMSWSAAGAAFLQGLHQIRRLSFLNIGVSALYLALAVPAARRFGVAGAFAAIAVSHAALVLASLRSLPREARRPAPWNRRTREIVARGMKLGWPLLVSSLALALTGWLLRAWLGRTVNLSEVGHYQVAETLNQAILFVPLALAVPLFPLASTMAASPPEDRARTFGPVFGYVALFTLPASLVVGWGARVWVGFFGPEYQDAWPLVYLLSAGYYLSSLGTVTGALLAGFGLTLDSMKLTVLWAFLFLVPGSLLAPRFGAAGVAVAQVASYAIQAAVLTVYFRRRLGMRFLPAPGIMVLFVLLFAGGLFILPRVEPIVGALLVIPASGLVLLAAGDLTRRAWAHARAWLLGNPWAGS